MTPLHRTLATATALVTSLAVATGPLLHAWDPDSTDSEADV